MYKSLSAVAPICNDLNVIRSVQIAHEVGGRVAQRIFNLCPLTRYAASTRQHPLARF